MSEQLHTELERLKMDSHLIQHRLRTLEEEQLPRRVASMEPVVARLELKMDDLAQSVDNGLREVRDAINGQKHMQKGMMLAVVATVGLIQLLPYLKGLLQ